MGGDAGHRVLRRLRPTPVVGTPGRDHLRGQGHSCWRLRPDHRPEQPRRRRSGRRAADLPPAVLPEADGRNARRVDHPLRHRPVPTGRGLRRRGDPRPRPVGGRRGGARIDGRRRRRSGGRPDPVGGRGRDHTVRRVRHRGPIGARRPGGRGGSAGRRGDGPPGGDRGTGRRGRRGDRVLRRRSGPILGDDGSRPGDG